MVYFGLFPSRNQVCHNSKCCVPAYFEFPCGKCTQCKLSLTQMYGVVITMGVIMTHTFCISETLTSNPEHDPRWI